MEQTLGIYIHVPFCEHKCYYCDFYSIVAGAHADFAGVVSSYLVSLRKEALLYQSQWAGHYFNSLFLGGGTPTILPAEDLAELVTFFRTELPLFPQAEITVEANPNTLSYEGLKLLGAAGVNRISLGAQAFQIPCCGHWAASTAPINHKQCKTDQAGGDWQCQFGSDVRSAWADNGGLGRYT